MPVSIPYPVANGTTADGAQMQANLQALVTGVNNALQKDGSIAMTAAFNAGGFKLSAVADPTLAQDAATRGWVLAQGYTVGSFANYAPLASPPLTGVPLANAIEIGFRDLPANSQTAAYTFALTDRGKCVTLTTGGFIIPSNASVAFPVGSIVSGYNDSGATQALTITTDTLQLSGGALTGARTVAQHGMFTLWKKSATVWIASGDLT